MGKKNNRILIICAVCVVIINIFFFQLCRVSGESMAPTYSGGEILLINKITNDFERMDIVVVRKDGKLLIKRLVGMPGETVQIEDNQILINDEKIEDVVDCDTEPGIAAEKIVLGEGEFFILGDNRGNSKDSRDESVGVVTKSEIIGKIVSLIPHGE